MGMASAKVVSGEHAQLGHDVSPRPVGEAQRSRRTLVVGALGLYLAAGLYLILVIHAYAGDAVSRVANAYYILFSRNPHLGAIGFVWNPLPSLLALPLAALHPWIPALVSRNFAGVVLSAGFGAMGVGILYDLLGELGLDPRWRVPVVAAYALNPLVVLYGANGMTDLMLATCILGTTRNLLAYVNTRSLKALTSAAGWLVVGFGVRYEAVPLAGVLVVALIVALRRRATPAELAGTAALLVAPLVWAAGVWIYFNWSIMKNPLYFLTSDYGNLAQIATGAYYSPGIAAARHHLVGTLTYVGHFTLLFWPMDIATPVAVWAMWRRRPDVRAPVLLGATVGAVLLEIGFLYAGHLGQWDRYFLSFIPMGIVLTAYAFVQLRARITRVTARTVLGVVFVLLLISGSAGTVLTLESPGWGEPDGSWLAAAVSGRSMRDSASLNPFSSAEPVVRYADSHPQMTILADTFTDYAVVLRAANPRQFIITSDYDFQSILNNPRGRVGAILVPEPQGVARLNAVNVTWPGLWAGRVPWATLIRSFPGGLHYRLYRAGPAAP
jgi:hypothetical protein